MWLNILFYHFKPSTARNNCLWLCREKTLQDFAELAFRQNNQIKFAGRYVPNSRRGDWGAGKLFVASIA